MQIRRIPMEIEKERPPFIKAAIKILAGVSDPDDTASKTRSFQNVYQNGYH